MGVKGPPYVRGIFETLDYILAGNRWKSCITNIENDTDANIETSQVLQHVPLIADIKIRIKSKVTKIIKHYESGEYDLIATGDKCFQVIERSKINDLWVGNIEYMKTPEIEDKNILKSVQNKYLELLIKLKNEKNFELLMDKDISFQFLAGISLPIDIKRNILMLDNETKRLIYINDLFKNILSQKIQNTENNFPEA